MNSHSSFNMNRIFPAVFAFFLLSVFSHADGLKSESHLRRVLFANYDKLVRPVLSATDNIPVKVNLSPAGVRDVDVKEKEIKLDVWLYIKWQDVHFKWDRIHYEIDHLSIPASEVWKPDISIYTAVSDSMFPAETTNVLIYHNGTVLWVAPMTFKSRCPPTQNQVTSNTFQCTVQLGSWTYDVGALDVHENVANPLARASSEGFLNINPKWILESMTASRELKKYDCCTQLYSVVKYDLKFRKRPGS